VHLQDLHATPRLMTSSDEPFYPSPPGP